MAWNVLDNGEAALDREVASATSYEYLRDLKRVTTPIDMDAILTMECQDTLAYTRENK